MCEAAPVTPAAKDEWPVSCLKLVCDRFDLKHTIRSLINPPSEILFIIIDSVMNSNAVETVFSSIVRQIADVFANRFLTVSLYIAGVSEFSLLEDGNSD